MTKKEQLIINALIEEWKTAYAIMQDGRRKHDEAQTNYYLGQMQAYEDALALINQKSSKEKVHTVLMSIVEE